MDPFVLIKFLLCNKHKLRLHVNPNSAIPPKEKQDKEKCTTFKCTYYYFLENVLRLYILDKDMKLGHSSSVPLAINFQYISSFGFYYKWG